MVPPSPQLNLKRLSARTRNALLRAGFRTWGDVRRLPPERLHAVRNLGEKGVAEISEFLQESAEYEPIAPKEFDEHSGDPQDARFPDIDAYLGSLSPAGLEFAEAWIEAWRLNERAPSGHLLLSTDECLAIVSALASFVKEGPTRATSSSGAEPKEDPLEAVLASLRPTHRLVLEQRLGIGTGTKTLQEIAEIVGVSRERIRQIQQKSLRTIPADLRRELGSAVRASLEQQGGVVLSGSEPPEWETAFPGAPAAALVSLLGTEMRAARIDTIQIEDALFVGTNGAIESLRLKLQAISEEVQAIDVPTPRSEVVRRFQWEGNPSADALLNVLYGDVRWLCRGRRPKSVDFVLMVIRQAGRPLHISDIHGRVRDLMGADAPSQASIHNILQSRNDLFVLRGRGLYTAGESIPSSSAPEGIRRRRGVGDDIERILADAAKEVSLGALEESILSDWSIQRNSVAAAIAQDRRRRFYRRGEMVGLTVWLGEEVGPTRRRRKRRPSVEIAAGPRKKPEPDGVGWEDGLSDDPLWRPAIVQGELTLLLNRGHPVWGIVSTDDAEALITSLRTLTAFEWNAIVDHQTDGIRAAHDVRVAVSSALRHEVPRSVTPHYLWETVSTALSATPNHPLVELATHAKAQISPPNPD